MVKMSPINLVIGLMALAGTAKAATTLPQHRYQLNSILEEQIPMVLASAPKPKKAEEPVIAQAPVPMARPEVVCEAPPEELLMAIRQERELLAGQKGTISERTSSIDLASQKLAIETANLEELKGKIEALLAGIELAQSADLDRLVKLYSSMKPTEAANIMNDLDIGVTVIVLGAMQERTAGPIMAKMMPIRARAVSKIILERSKLPGDQDYSGLKLD